jgi:hypothetical protein
MPLCCPNDARGQFKPQRTAMYRLGAPRGTLRARRKRRNLRRYDNFEGHNGHPSTELAGGIAKSGVFAAFGS